jgi:hypothetical protein
MYSYEVNIKSLLIAHFSYGNNLIFRNSSFPEQLIPATGDKKTLLVEKYRRMVSFILLDALLNLLL